MTPSSDELAFLAAIAADPDEDTHRLVYADWLDEQDRHDRAELIRVQVKLALFPAEKVGWKFLEDGTSLDAESRAVRDDDPQRERLQRRESELLARMPSKCPCPQCKNATHYEGSCVCDGSGDFFMPFGDGAKRRTITYHRGLSRIACTLEELVQWVDVWEKGEPQPEPSPWALAVAREAGVVEFELTCRSPSIVYRDRNGAMLHYLARGEWSDIRPESPLPGFLPPPFHAACGTYSTAEEAHTSVARVAGKWVWGHLAPQHTPR